MTDVDVRFEKSLAADHGPLPEDGDNPLDHYVPECYISAAADRMYWFRGVTSEQIAANKKLLVAAVLRACALALGEDVDGDEPVLPWPPGWLPEQFIASMASRIAGPVWPAYTEAQRERMVRYAARYVRGDLNKWYGEKTPEQKERDDRYLITREMRAALPYQVTSHMRDTWWRSTEYRRWLVVFWAYLETHPGDEARGEDLHLIHEHMGKPEFSCRFFF